MYCIKCGADNLETAKFCRKCGADVSGQQSAVSSQPEEPEEETRVAPRFDVRESENIPIRDELDDIANEAKAYSRGGLGARIGGDADTDATEAEIFSITPTLMFVKAGYVLAAIGALLLVAVTSSFLSQYVSVWEAVLIGLLLFLIPAFYHFKRKLVRYTLTDSKLEIDEGFISRNTRNVPIRRIQDVTVSSSMMQRLLGFGNLVIDNASDEGGKVVLKNINTPKHYADILLRQMRRLDR
jgi:membrane protein YdbS with pleckstrin-like domain